MQLTIRLLFQFLIYSALDVYIKSRAHADDPMNEWKRNAREAFISIYAITVRHRIANACRIHRVAPNLMNNVIRSISYSVIEWVESIELTRRRHLYSYFSFASLCLHSFQYYIVISLAIEFFRRWPASHLFTCVFIAFFFFFFVFSRAVVYFCNESQVTWTTCAAISGRTLLSNDSINASTNWFTKNLTRVHSSEFARSK